MAILGMADLICQEDRITCVGAAHAGRLRLHGGESRGACYRSHPRPRCSRYGRGNMGVSGLLSRVLLVCAAALLVAPVPANAQFNQFEIKEPKVEKGEVEIDYLGDYQV